MIKLDSLNEYLVELISNNLTDIKDKRNLCIINKFFYENMSPMLEKYKLIIYLNRDYLNFYTTLNKYNYSEDIKYMNKLVIKSFMDIPNIWSSNICCMYDLRYIFELMFNGYGLVRDIKIYNVHFYIHFYQKILDCISIDRKETLDNIEKCPYLFSLKSDPKFKNVIRNGRNFKWIPLAH